MVTENQQPDVNYLSLLTRYGIYVVFVALAVAFSLAIERFFTVENLLLILQQASPLGIAVVGMVFVLMVSAGQIGSVAAGFGEGNEFMVISTAVLGGTSLFGGKGNIFPGAIIGILLITTIMNGLAMINASPFIYTIVRGVIIFFAIALDSFQRKGELR